MSSDAELIRKNQDREGMRFRALEFIIQLYTDKSHFIYELLQNAEDARANIIRFIQYDDRLEVLHDGKPFTYSNLEGLCDIGKSDKDHDLNSIGKFGVGFKSVYGICSTVKLFSDPTHYKGELEEHLKLYSIEIQDFTKPVDISPEPIPPEFTTRFVFPYSVGQSYSGFDSMESLNRKLSNRLQNLGINVLLFMKNLSTIEYEINTEVLTGEGRYELSRKKLSDLCTIVSAQGETTKEKEHQEGQDFYLLFSKSLKGAYRSVDIAFSVVKKEDGTFKCEKSKDPYISVYFPTETESKLDFIVQGPYRTTPNRESIPADDIENIRLAIETSNLLKACLLDLKKMNLLDLSFVKVLPLDKKRFDNFPLFRPMFDAVKNAFEIFNILPCESGGYVSRECAKIGRSKKMRQLVDDGRLKDLIGDGQNYRWLPGEVSETNSEYSTVYEFFVNILSINVIRPEDLCLYFNRNLKFLRNQEDTWLIDLYSLFEDIAGSFVKKRSNTERLTCPFIKTSQKKFVSPYKINADGKLEENVFIGSDKFESMGLNFVYKPIYDQCRHFFDDILKIDRPNEFDIMVEQIKRHKGKEETLSDNTHIDDIKFILKYYLSDSEREAKVQSLIDNYLALRCSDGSFYRPFAKEIYVPNTKDGINIKDYFQNAVEDIYFIDTEFYESNGISYGDFRKLGVHTNLLKDAHEFEGSCFTDGKGYVSHYSKYKVTYRKRWVTEKFPWELSLRHIGEILIYISNHPHAEDSILKSEIIMDCLFKCDGKLQGDVEIKGGTPNQKDSPCLLIKQLRGEEGAPDSWNKKWLYNQSRELVAPKSITCYDLNTDIYGPIKTNSAVYDLLHFKKSDSDTVREITGKMTKKEQKLLFENMFEQYFGFTLKDASVEPNFPIQKDKNDDTEDFNYSEVEFPVGRVKNWEAIRKHAAEMLAYAYPVKYEQKLRSIRTSDRRDENRAYLKNMYSIGKTNQCVCQLCHQIMPNIVSAELFKEPDLELDPLHLCLCPNCHTKYKELRNLDSTMQQLRYNILNIKRENVLSGDQVIIPVDGEELWFAQTHFAEIQELLRLKKDVSEETEKPSTEDIIIDNTDEPWQSENNRFTRAERSNGPMQDETKKISGNNSVVKSSMSKKSQTQLNSNQDSYKDSEKALLDEQKNGNGFPNYSQYVGKKIFHKKKGFKALITSCNEDFLTIEYLTGFKSGTNAKLSTAGFLKLKEEGTYEIVN